MEIGSSLPSPSEDDFREVRFSTFSFSEVIRRIIVGLASVISRLQYPSVYVSLGIGVILAFYSFQAQHVINDQEESMMRALVRFDNFFEQSISGINTFIAETPNKTSIMVNVL
jgi:hypothetical protein